MCHHTKRGTKMSKSNHNPIRMIGACAPSSKHLADAMTRFVTKQGSNARILEVGAGTGAITKFLIKKMSDGQKLDVVEIIPSLSQILCARFKGLVQVTVHCSDILNYQANAGYDVIVSSLPFNAFPPELTNAVMERLVELANDQAILSFFEYKVLERVAPLVFSKKRLEQYRASRKLIEGFLRRFKFDQAVVNMNLPPAVVHYLAIDKHRQDQRS